MGHNLPSPNRIEQRKVAQETLKRLFAAAVSQWPGFQERKAQKRAMGALLDAFMNYKLKQEPTTGRNIAILDAGTGFGKTVGYGLPALAAAFATGKKIVISTATVALQEQLFNRDIPRLAAVSKSLGFDLTYTLLKGRQRYVCLQKLDMEIMGESLSGDYDDPQQGSASGEQIRLYSSMANALQSSRWSGDRDALDSQVDDASWRRVQADRGTCPGRRCQHYSGCSYFRARSGVKEAQLIVANHSLVLASLSQETGQFDPAETIFIFDEGHHLDQVATQLFAPRYGLAGARRALQALDKGLAYACSLAGAEAAAINMTLCKRSIANLVQHHAVLQEQFANTSVFDRSPIFRYQNGALPPALIQAGNDMLPDLLKVMDYGIEAMNALRAVLRDTDDATRRRVNRLIIELGPAVLRVRTMAALWRQWVHHGKVPRAKWVEAVGGGSSQDIQLCASSLTSAGDLVSHLWSKAAAAAIASATLTTANGSFEYFRRTTGLSRLSDVIEVQAASPFDYERQGRIHVVVTRNQPDDLEQFSLEVQELMPAFLADGAIGQLALFSSRRQMQSVYERLPVDIREQVLMQDQMPKSLLIATHSQRVKSGQRSIIFGLQSFGEGVDLPGDLCGSLFIDKLPFKPPGGPAEEALAEWLRSQKRNPFDEVTIPQLVQTLKQWVGRAIRTTEDTATITVFDPRLLTKQYGKTLLASLPPMPVFRIDV